MTDVTSTAQFQGPLAHNTKRSGPNNDVPVLILDPTDFPFAPGEREREWHPATEAEVEAFDRYWCE